MNWFSAILTAIGLINRSTKNKRIVVGKGDNVILDIDRLPPGDPGHDVDPRPKTLLLLLPIILLTQLACGYWWKVIEPVPQPPPPTQEQICKEKIDKVKVLCISEPWTDECIAAQSDVLTAECFNDIVPICTPPTLVTNCWHQPPGMPWQWIPAPVIPPTPPTPTPEPPAPPTPPTPVPGDVPDQPAGTSLKMNNREYGGALDSSLKVEGPNAQAYCASMGWTDGRQSCAVAQDQDPRRLALELKWMGKIIGKAQACPVWQFTLDKANIIPCHDDHDALASCDHFGSTTGMDDPNTPGFEGTPTVCGEQRWNDKPDAGFYMRPHSGKVGFVRACLPDYTGCGPWIASRWR